MHIGCNKLLVVYYSNKNHLEISIRKIYFFNHYSNMIYNLTFSLFHVDNLKHTIYVNLHTLHRYRDKLFTKTNTVCCEESLKDCN